MVLNEEFVPSYFDSEANQSDENFFYPQMKQNVSGIRNFIAPSSSFVNVQGSDNNVGEDCRYVNISGSSGCVVYGGLNNVSIINSSGVIVTESNQMYVNGRKHPNEDYIFIETNYNLVSTDSNIEFVGNAPRTATINDEIFTRGKILRFINAGSDTLTVSVASGIIGNSGAATTKVLATGTACGIIFNGTNWRIIYG